MDVLTYHDRSKHRFSGFARGPQTIDWESQPDPFRRYEGAPVIPLPLQADKWPVASSALWNDTSLPAHALSRAGIALLLEMSLALSAWKQAGSARWSLRCNPSSGNLHPTEAYIIACGMDDLADGIYHYRADLHALEYRCQFLVGTAPAPLLCLGLSSIHWREAWKYGERAYRYCQHDVGHAMAALAFAARTLGWTITPALHVGDRTLSHLLGIDRDNDYHRAEREHADVLLSLSGGLSDDALTCLSNTMAHGSWQGRANILDHRHFFEWPVIDDIHASCARPDTRIAPVLMSIDTWPGPMPTTWPESAADLFRRRRSAQAFDGTTIMRQSDFFRTLDHLLFRQALAPWTATPWQTRLHLVLFVHRVEGLAPGIYALPRRHKAEALMQNRMRQEFVWQRVDAAPAHLPLFHLLTARTGRSIATLSCQQAIAADGVFSVAMLAEFATTIDSAPWRYRELFWEAGVIGQCLYLEAETSGLRGTGIGCYFDDEVHELLGLQDDTLQSLYHFTIGAPVNDARLISLPAYGDRHASDAL
jgi:SagB-type dehydrogenase family enzyme